MNIMLWTEKALINFKLSTVLRPKVMMALI